jgi:hypothetical protein
MKAAPSVAPRLWRAKPAAQYLGISPGTLRALVQSGELHPVILGKATSPWLFDIRELDALIDRTKTI